MKLDLGGVTTVVSGVSKKDVVKKLQELGYPRDVARRMVYKGESLGRKGRAR